MHPVTASFPGYNRGLAAPLAHVARERPVV